jgi:hypothetical protein
MEVVEEATSGEEAVTLAAQCARGDSDGCEHARTQWD